MWSIEAALLIWVACCVGVIAWALHRLRGELEPTRSAFELHDVTRAVALVGRETGRAAASRRLLVRHGNAPVSR